MNPETVARRLPGVRGLTLTITVLTSEAVVLGLYLADPTGTITDPLRLLYPFVWINAAAVGVWVTDVPKATGRRRLTAAALSAAYLLVLAYFGGVVSPGYELATGPSSPGWYLSSGLPPGYGPAAVYEGALLTLVLVPYKLLGYAALTYLVYATILDAASSAITGIVGLLSCVSCSWPIIAAIATGIAGSGSALATAAYDSTLWLSTLVFVVTIALLAWRPTIR